MNKQTLTPMHLPCRQAPHRMILCLILMVMLGIATTAQAENRFSERSLRGSWGFSASGTVFPPALPSPTPAAAVGLMSFDGEGGCAFRDRINIGGMATPDFRDSFECRYSVNPDGTGSISVSFVNEPGPVPLSFVIINQRELRFIRTDAGVAEGVAKRRRP